MTAEECITGRRSVRKFTDQAITPELLEHIVGLARYAPSWKNSQPVRYHATTQAKLIARIGLEAAGNFAPNARTIQRAKAVVILTVRERISGYEPDGTPSTPQGEHWQSFDAGIAAQTFCLAAYSCGIGSVILGIYDEKALRDLLPIPSGEKVACLIALGYPLQPDKPAPPRLDVSELLDLTT